MKLATRAAIGTASIVFVTSVLILAYASTIVSKSMIDNAESQLALRVMREVTVSARLLNRAKRDALEIAVGPILTDYLAAGRTAAARAHMQESIRRVLAVRDEYRQMRILDVAGREIVRVMRNEGDVYAIPDDELQDKSQRDYFKALRELAPGEAMAWNVTLNREFGQIERPLRPTIRVLAPIFDRHGEFAGGVSLNMKVEYIFPPRRSGPITFRVVLPDGSYARHPDPTKEHGGELGTGEGLKREFGFEPTDSAYQFTGKVALESLDEPILAAQGFFRSGARPDAAQWRLIATQPTAIALSEMNSVVWKLQLAALGIAVLFSAGGALASLWVTRRVKALAHAAHRVADGDFSVRLDDDGRDELADTARAFNAMTARVSDLIDAEAEAREKMSKLNSELVRSNRELENFARVTSHDLKSPLRPLAVLPDWIEEDLGEIPEDVRGHLDEMRRQAARMTDLVDGLLQYSLAGSGEARAAPVDLADMVSTIVGTLGGHENFGFDLDLPAVPVDAVRTEVDIVIRNLVQNAIKHHDRGNGRISVAVAQDRHALTIEVGDDGPGIPEPYREKVLEPLVTLKSRDDGGGSGLGLAIVAKIAERWNGRVEVLSEDGVRGTVIRVVLSRPTVIELTAA